MPKKKKNERKIKNHFLTKNHQKNQTERIEGILSMKKKEGKY